MSKDSPNAFDLVLEAFMKEAIDSKRHSDLLVASTIGYLVFRARGDSDSEQRALELATIAIDAMLVPERRHQCSFCGRAEPEVRLAAGQSASSFICDSCVKTLDKAFRPE